MKLLAIIAILAIAGLATETLWWGALDGDAAAGAVPAHSLHTVKRGAFVVVLTENGTLVAKESQKVNYRGRRSSEITWLVEEGAEIEEGAELAKLDTKDLEERLERSEDELLSADANKETAQTNLEIEEVENKAKAERAAEALVKAGKELEKYVEGQSINDRRKLDVAIQDAETSYNRSEKKYADSQELFEKDYINASQLQEDEIQFQKAQAQREGARLDLEIFEKYTLPMTLAEKQRAVTDAERELTTVEKRNASSLRQKQVSLEKSVKSLENINDEIAETTEDIDKMILVAPCPGIVLYGDPKQPWQRGEIKIGGRVWGGVTMMTIPDLRVMQVKLYVHEADISKIKAGQRATVTMDTYPGLVLQGEVSKIATIAGGENPWENNPEVKTFAVEITLEETTGVELKPGISAKAEIFIDRREDVLSVPLQCVFLEEGQHYCYGLDKAGQPEKRAVTAGLSNDNYLEIVEGLEEDERVLLYNPNLPGATSGGAGDQDGAAGGTGEQTDDETDAVPGEGGSDDGGTGATTPT